MVKPKGDRSSAEGWRARGGEVIYKTGISSIPGIPRGSCGSTALKARVLARFSDSACRKHVLASVPRVLGFRPGQPTFPRVFADVRSCAQRIHNAPLRTSGASWVALRLHSSGVFLPRPGCVIRLRLESLFTSRVLCRNSVSAGAMAAEA